MKLLVILILFIYFLIAGQAYAHVGGVPIVKINGQFTEVNVDEGIKSTMNVPSDRASENYMSGTPVEFEVIPNLLPYPDEITEQATYSWDFGDGITKEGTKVEHMYEDNGSYQVRLKIDFGDLREFGIAENELTVIPEDQTILLHSVPSKEYIIPKPVVYVDEKSITDPDKATISLQMQDKIFGIFNRQRSISFDASASEGTGKISSYSWDFGDGQVKGVRANHTFSEDRYLYDVLLKIEDENNFHSYLQMSLVNGSKNNGGSPNGVQLFFMINAGVIGITVLLLIVWRLFRGSKEN